MASPQFSDFQLRIIRKAVTVVYKGLVSYDGLLSPWQRDNLEKPITDCQYILDLLNSAIGDGDER